MRRLAAIQSSYIPWKGYFDVFGSVDEFILYDDVQYSKNGPPFIHEVSILDLLFNEGIPGARRFLLSSRGCEAA